MLNTLSLLDEAKAHAGLTSDYGLAKAIGVAPNYIANYRRGRSRPDEVIAERLARVAGLDPDYVVACLQAERTSYSLAHQDVWARIAKRLQGTAGALATVILSAWAGLQPAGDAQAASLQALNAGGLSSSEPMYTLSRLLMAARASVRGALARLITSVEAAGALFAPRHSARHGFTAHGSRLSASLSA